MSGVFIGAAVAQVADVDYPKDPRVAVVTWTELPGEMITVDKKEASYSTVSDNPGFC